MAPPVVVTAAQSRIEGCRVRSVSAYRQSNLLSRIYIVFGFQVYIVAVVIAVAKINTQEAIPPFIGIVAGIFCFQYAHTVFVYIFLVRIGNIEVFIAAIQPFSASIEVKREAFFKIVGGEWNDWSTDSEFQDVRIAAFTDDMVCIILHFAGEERIAVFGNNVHNTGLGVAKFCRESAGHDLHVFNRVCVYGKRATTVNRVGNAHSIHSKINFICPSSTDMQFAADIGDSGLQ